MFLLRSLRRHDPDQVRGSRACGPPLSLATPGSPCMVILIWLSIMCLAPGCQGLPLLRGKDGRGMGNGPGSIAI